ncbi:hypothetical protein F2Q70_00013172 [Brassica cretica]|uniref:RNase H type-1 domain-containing protein n=1 Tax=Brassica cretica TaxID=69181 RepID=A0A8S9LWH3_BRACR|nr:hypothetical protein F2Q68_00006258 [Brassica cretica]KAF2611685.1 hypothetical protein F2Q70_00013172 [Brassica cretica]
MALADENLLWQIWKARNRFCFEHVNPVASVIVSCAMDQAVVWLNLHGHITESLVVTQPEPGVVSEWTKPPTSFLKCNVGSSWSQASSVGGAGWIIRDSSGKALVHSRRSFSGISSSTQADLMALSWAAAALVDLRLKNVMFEFSSPSVAEVLNNPLINPFSYHNCYEVLRNVHAVARCSLQLVSTSSNTAAYAIALSVTRDNRHHSYVASNGPSWLASLLSQEATSR